jgi:putative endonuclease
MRTVYILQSLSDPRRYYTGLSYAPNGRALEHNAGLSTHTRQGGPWQIVVSIQFRDPNKAFLFERYLKTGSGRAFAKRHL